MLSLLDACSGNDLQFCFGKKVIGANQELLVQIKDIVVKYSLPIEFANKTLGDILDDMLLLKSEYKNKIYSEKEMGIASYTSIKNEYNAVCKK